MFWSIYCSWCQKGFNGEIMEHDGKNFHPKCLQEYIFYIKGIKEECDREIKRSLDLISSKTPS